MALQIKPTTPVFVQPTGPATVTSNMTQASIGALLYPILATEGSNVVNGWYPYGDIRRYGAVADAVISAGTGTDNSAAINAALSIIGQATFVPAGDFGFKNILVPGGQTLYGLGIHVSNLIALPGATGTMCGDGDSSASKTDIFGLAFYCQGNTLDPGSLNVTSYTAGFRFGHGIAHGTEGSMRDVWVRALPSGFPGIDIVSNVGKYANLYAQTTGGLRILGTGIALRGGCESYASQGFVNTAGVTVLTDLGDGQGDLIEIEAGATGITPYFLTGNFALGKLVWGPASGRTVDHVIQIGANATTWSVSLQSYFAGTPGTITGGAVYWAASGAYRGGTSSGGTHTQDQNYVSALLNATSGTATFSGVTTTAVAFPQAVPTTSYKVALSQSASSALPPWITSKSTTGFTINFSASFTGGVDWVLFS